MTKQQLIDSLKSKFSFVEEAKQTSEETFGDKKIFSFSIPVIDIIDNSFNRRNIYFYVDELDNAYWQEVEPKKEVNQRFYDKVQSFVSTKITDGTVKFGVINEVNEETKTAKCEAIMPDKSTKVVLIKEVNNKLQIETL